MHSSPQDRRPHGGNPQAYGSPSGPQVYGTPQGQPSPGYGSAQIPQGQYGSAQAPQGQYGSAQVPQGQPSPGHGAAQVPQGQYGSAQVPQGAAAAAGFGAPPVGQSAQPRPAEYGRPAGQGEPSPAGAKAGKPRKRRKGVLVTVLALVVALGAGLGGVAVFKPDLMSNLLAAPDWQSPSAAPPAEPAAAPVLAALTGAPVPDAALLKQALDPLIEGSPLGDNVSASVVDISTGEVLYERTPTKMITPASNTKLVTAAAVLSTRGPDYRITTRVVAGPNPGEVVLIGAGDATLGVTAKKFYEGAAQLDDLAAQVKKAMGTTPITKVITDGGLFTGPVTSPDWPSDTLSEGTVSRITALMINGTRSNLKQQVMPFTWYSDPERAAGDAFAKLLGLTASAKGAAPEGAATGSAAPSPQGSTAAAGPPAPGTELGSVRSAPLLRQVEQMLTESDNTLAEALARQVALAKGQPASFAGAAAAMEQVVTELGLDAAQSDLLDGSGMSPKNKISPQVLTALLVKAAGGTDSHLSDFFNGLPVAGWSGTMGARFAKSKAGFGVVRAKSGTLNGVNALSGVVQTADGRLLAFAVLADGVPVDRDTAQNALDRIAAAIAVCGCR
ncbi:D-alanyl-D-alanine carboxypeptidase/D-alanyl-D-alanine endopeptidase [Catellatospora citrea]|uniref:D-alanyl-D-alanine carboxypeptidase/D-alanyl-D-alanine endopeptidase n=1 Tax=Catellatospora citrea TaxID=53366 RepID=UPI000FF57478|nr:D-alanyl-D-alanine carboxypeptidase/D-alanyl-D-alanine-endopeptidase [Catellatospora citrea]RKE08667.1 D-alanyl-D-alanine carboxypeptidase/D-alanyl-D-alanine-endopeptidase (penicillin-binding protein 4) [Catellatospora citrea]